MRNTTNVAHRPVSNFNQLVASVPAARVRLHHLQALAGNSRIQWSRKQGGKHQGAGLDVHGADQSLVVSMGSSLKKVFCFFAEPHCPIQAYTDVEEGLF